MNATIIYLDSTAIVKRYIKERGSDGVREFYVKAYNGEHRLSFSLWNIGEVLWAFDRARRVNRLDEDEYYLVRGRFLIETRRLSRLGILDLIPLKIADLIPLKIAILIESWRLIEKYHIYEADAIQIASAKHIKAENLLASDKRLYEIALSEGLNSIYLE